MIQIKRKKIWDEYHRNLKEIAAKGFFELPVIPEYATNNGSSFYLVCRSLRERTALIEKLKGKGIHAVFHYLPLHKAPYFEGKHDGRVLANADRYADCLVRLPMFYELSKDNIKHILKILNN